MNQENSSSNAVEEESSTLSYSEAVCTTKNGNTDRDEEAAVSHSQLAQENIVAVASLAKSDSTNEDVDSGSNSLGRTHSLMGFDVLRFKDNFLEMVEELRLQRMVKIENEKHIEKLLVENHELSHKLDEAVSLSNTITESHEVKVQDLAKKHEGEVQQYKGDLAKSVTSQETREKELKALKDEMRALHLTKHILEKKVQEQERQIQLHSSSRETYLSKMTQLEEKCSSLFKLAENASDNMATLEANVKQAKVLHQRLECVNSHQCCELEQARRKLESCRQELIESRARRLDTEEEDRGGKMAIKHRATEHDLKMQVELSKHLQDQLCSLREEHQGVLRQLKEAHTLLERHVEKTTRATENEEKTRKELEELRSGAESLRESLSLAEHANATVEERHAAEKETLEKKNVDTEHRLTTLQADYKLLQDSYDNLDAAKAATMREHALEMNALRANSIQMEEDIVTLKNELKNLQSALDQSEVELLKCEEKLQEKEKVISGLRSRSSEVQSVVVCVERKCAGLDQPPTQFSPEVISTNTVETPTLVIQQTPGPTSSSSGEHKASEFTDTAIVTRAEELVELPEDPVQLQPPQAKKPKLDQEIAAVDCAGARDTTNTPSNSAGTRGAVRSQDEAAPSLHMLASTPNEEKNRPEEEDMEEEAVCVVVERKRSDVAAAEDKPDAEEKATTGKEVDKTKDLDLKTPAGSPEVGGGAAREACSPEGGASLEFSPEVGEVGGRDEERMLNTQMNKQIERVEVFLKMDRLRREKPRK